MSKTKHIICIISSALIIIIAISLFCVIRENELRRAFLSTESLTFDGMEFVRCTDYAHTNTLENSEVICKTFDGSWKIKSVKGYEEDLEYVYVRSFMDGYYYERIK